MKKFITIKSALIAAGVVFLLLLIIGFNKKPNSSTMGRHTLTATVSEGPLDIFVSAYGEVQANKSHKIESKTRFETALTFIIEEGNRVEEGDVVCRLDTIKIDDYIKELEERISDNEIQTDNLKSELAIQKMDNEQNSKDAEQLLQQAEIELKKFEEAERPMNLRKIDLDVNSAASTLSRKQKRFTDLESLLKRGFITEDEVEEGRIELETAEVALETANIDKEVMIKYLIPEQLTILKNGLDKAKLGKEKTNSKNTTNLNNKQTRYDQALRKLKELRNELAEHREQLLDYELKAPTSGIVKYGDSSRGSYGNDKDYQVGTSIRSREVIMTIPSLEDLKVSLNISESDIDKIKVGQKASLEVDALEGQAFPGEVVHVAELAKSQNWYSRGVKEFEIEINFEDMKGLKPGFSCKAEIKTDAIEKATIAPIQAIFKEEENLFAYIKHKGKAKKVPVEIGKLSITHAEILKGLKSGDEVYLSAPIEAETDS